MKMARGALAVILKGLVLCIASTVVAATGISLDEESDEAITIEDSRPAKALGKITSSKVLFGANARNFAVVNAASELKQAPFSPQEVKDFASLLYGQRIKTTHSPLTRMRASF